VSDEEHLAAPRSSPHGRSRRGLLIAVAVSVLAVAAAAAFFAMRARPQSVGRAQVQSLYDSGRYADAVREGRALVVDTPGDIEARRVLALALSASSDTTGAVEQYDAILGVAPEDHTSLFRRALLERVTGDHTAAISDLSKANALSPDTTSYLEELAKTYALAGENERAIATWRDALGIKTLSEAQRAAFLRQLAQGYEVAGRKEDARRTWRRVLDLLPDDPQALDAYGR
jgi:tetratricopeptide (TPR) repeat protein